MTTIERLQYVAARAGLELKASSLPDLWQQRFDLVNPTNGKTISNVSTTGSTNATRSASARAGTGDQTKAKP